MYGKSLPVLMMQKTAGGLSAVPIANPTSEKIKQGNAYLARVVSAVAQNTQNVSLDNPVLTALPAAKQVSVTPQAQQTVQCYYKSGLFYITYDAHNSAHTNPAQSILEIKALNDLFTQKDALGQYFTMITPTHPEANRSESNTDLTAYVGQVVAVGTTMVPGDTLCVARYAVPQD
jgi:hypothetical protein